MSYSKYYLYKKQVSYDNGVTWVDVTPLETQASGDPIATYETLEECENPPFDSKFKATYIGGQTYSAACDGNTELTSATTKPSGYDSHSMASARIGDCVTSIGKDAFSYCTSLTSVTIPSGVTSIGYDAFYECNSLTSVNIPSGVTSISHAAFYYCSGLASVTIPNSVTSIEDSTFAWCSSLSSVTIGSGVTSIGTYAFADCRSLTRITCNAIVPPALTDSKFTFLNTKIGSIYVPCESVNAYRTAPNWSDYASRITCGSPTGLKFKATYSDSTTYSAECDSSVELTSATTKPSGYEYTEMTSSEIGDCVTTISGYSFAWCSSLSSVAIGSGVTTIGTYAFYRCSGLTSVTVNATTPPALGTGAFNDTNNCPIYVPSASVNDYKSASGWSNYADRIQAIP